MSLRQKTMTVACACAGLLAAGAIVHSQGHETFKATAHVKTAGGATASAPVTITITRTMPQSEADKLASSFKTGGASALRAALKGVPPTGSVRLGSGPSTPTRITIERTTDKGRLLTMVTDKPILFLGSGVPGAKPKEGYDFAVVDIEVDAKGTGSGTLSPAAKLGLKDTAFVVQDYSAELVKLESVRKLASKAPAKSK
jgi:hypothetical protein